MSQGPGFLALVADDPIAPKLLAWWMLAKPQLDDFDSRLAEISRMLGVQESYMISTTFDRCKLAGLVLDGCISENAEQFLNVVVADRLQLHKVNSSLRFTI